MSILNKLINRFNRIPIKIPARFSVDIYMLILKFIWKGISSGKPKKSCKKNKVGEITPSGIVSYYIATIIKTVWQMEG